MERARRRRAGSRARQPGQAAGLGRARPGQAGRGWARPGGWVWTHLTASVQSADFYDVRWNLPTANRMIRAIE